MAFSQALYYPWIDIRDEHWLKAAALYWDTVYTIVPESVTSPYNESASKRLADEGILRPLHISSDAPEVESLAEDVLAFVNTQEAGELFFDPMGLRHRIHVGKLPYSLHSLSLNRQKLPFLLRRKFDEIGRNSEWIDVEPEFGHFYMTLLATRLAQSRGLGLLTPSFPSARLASRARAGSALNIDYASYRDPRELAEGTLIDLTLGQVSIDPNVTLDKLLRFRKQHHDELAHLRAKLGELVATVPDDKSITAIQQHVCDLIANEVEPALADLKAALEAAGVKTLTEGLLRVSFLSAAPTSALIASGISVPLALAAGAGISLAATGVLLAVEKRKAIRENPFAYLLSIERRLR
jgi:hypothetical protein